MEKCVTCGQELHPERAKKYNYCMSRECQEKNAKGLTMVAVGVNKAAEQYMILDEQTKEELASGKYHDQRRGSFGTSPAAPAPAPVSEAAPVSEPAPAAAAVPAPRPRPRPAARKVVHPPWSRSQQRLALLYNEQGLRPDEIAEKLGLSTYTVTQIILNTRSRGKLLPGRAGPPRGQGQARGGPAGGRYYQPPPPPPPPPPLPAAGLAGLRTPTRPLL
jgi:hypothetical protein